MSAWLLALLLAADLTPARAHELYVIAYGQYGSAHGGMPLPDKAPTIRLVPQEELKKLYNCEHCNVQGIANGEEIYLNEALDYNEPFPSSVLIHEYIHYFQFVQKGNAQSCPEALEREYEAYGIQLRLLEQAGQDTLGVRMAARFLRCPPT